MNKNKTIADLESTIALVNTENSNLICMWCGKDTTGDKTREHIFPECIGGKKRLPAGYVCANCNNHFSHRIDRALLKEHSGMMDAYQVDLGIKRKGKGKNSKKRYQEERKQIHGIGEASSIRIRRDGGNVEFLNAKNIVTSEYFVRSLHKCIANILCDLQGSIYVRESYPELLDFVNNGGDVHPWSYAVSYPNLFTRPLISEPQVINRRSININSKTHEIVSFIHTSGIWIVGSSPFLLNPNLIEEFSDSIINGLAHTKKQLSKKPITDYFGFEWDKEKRNSIGKLRFLWVVKEIEGKPNNDFLYLLTRCKVCGQINPTGIVLPRDIIYKGNTNHVTGHTQNTWNHYIINDLAKLGFKIEKWDNESLKKYMNQGISIPIENDVKRMKINNCKILCINCGIMITYSATNCFV